MMKRWQRIGENGAPSEHGHLVDTMAPPVVVSRPEYRDIEAPAEFPAGAMHGKAEPAADPAPAVECCERCGRPLIGGA